MHIEEALPVGGDQSLDAARVRFFLESVEARPGGALWLILIASTLPLLLQIFTKTNARDVKDAAINANDPTFIEQERCQSRGECSTKRQKAKHPSIELAPDEEDLFMATHLDVKNEAWQCTGYDMRSKTWRTLPPFSFLPDSEPDLSKLYSNICDHDSLTCANISDMGAELVVFNPLTGKKRPLPPLIFPRHPVLFLVLVDPATNSYLVIVVGSSSSGEDHLSKKMEVFDSKTTSKWEEICDLPGPAFGLNDYQAGVCASGIFYFISSLEGDGGKGGVAFDVKNGLNMTCLIPYSLNMLQLVDENNGELYLFYEQVGEPYNRHCIDVLEMSNSTSEEVSCHWRNVVPAFRNCGRGLLEYPEYMCGGFGEGKLCIFNSIEGGGVVYDVGSEEVSFEALKSLQDERSVIHSLMAAFHKIRHS